MLFDATMISGRRPTACAPPQMPCPAEAADHLIGDERDAITLQNRLDHAEIPIRRHDDTARPHHGLGEHAGNGLRAFRQNLLFEPGGKPGAIVLIAFTRQRKAPAMRTVKGNDLGIGQTEGPHVILARQRRGHDGGAMIGVLACQQLAPSGLAFRRPHHPQELDDGFIGIRARVCEKDTAHRHRRQFKHALGQSNGGLRVTAKEGVITGKLRILPGGNVGQARFGKSQRHVPKAGVALEIALAGGVEDIGAIAFLDDGRSILSQ